MGTLGSAAEGECGKKADLPREVEVKTVNGNAMTRDVIASGSDSTAGSNTNSYQCKEDAWTRKDGTHGTTAKKETVVLGCIDGVLSIKGGEYASCEVTGTLSASWNLFKDYFLDFVTEDTYEFIKSTGLYLKESISKTFYVTYDIIRSIYKKFFGEKQN